MFTGETIRLYFCAADAPYLCGVSTMRRRRNVGEFRFCRWFMEIWKEIPGTDYSVSNEGRLASRKYGKWRIMRLNPMRGYLATRMRINDAGRTVRVHILVAEAFLGQRPTPKHEINHKDGNRGNNHAHNLEWVTRSENLAHRYSVLKHGAPRGESSGTSRLTEAGVREIWARRMAGESRKSVADSFGISLPTVDAILYGKTWGWLAK